MSLPNQPTTNAPNGAVSDELILVVPREKMFPDGNWQGTRQGNFDMYLALIERHCQFHPRCIMETDPRYKQIIPYLVFTHEGSYFLMQRCVQATEQRLKGKMTLGIGGHIRQEDMHGSTFFDWAIREFHEEVDYQGSLNIEPLCMLNEDSTPVGQVHMGFVMLLTGNSSAITIKSELQSGHLATLQECIDQQENMETWSQLVTQVLIARQQETKNTVKQPEFHL